MGTRHLIAVKESGEYKIAQYGQWDGYPDGQGLSVLNFARDAQKMALMKAKLANIVRPTQDDLRRMYAEVGHDIDRSGGMISCDKAKKFSQLYPTLSRDAGADILDLVAASDGQVYLRNSITFAADGLFCEWAWVVDFDAGTFEAFKGFGKGTLPEGERFAFLNDKTENGYAPVRHVTTWKLDALPSDEDFLAAFKSGEDDDED